MKAAFRRIALLTGASLLAVAVATHVANAQQVEIHCKPVIVPRCENALKMHFEHGRVPNRCNVT